MINKNKIQFSFILFAMIIFIFIFRIAEFLTDYLWFDSLGFKSIFMVSIEAAVLLFFVSSLVFFVFLMLNLWIASKCRENLKNLIKFKTKFWISILLSFFIGTASASQWMTVLQYFRQISFGLADPILNKDVSFYIFTLPFFQAVLGFAFICVIFTVIFVIIDYFQSIIISFFKQPQVKNANGIPQYSINLKQELGKLKRKAIVHLSLLFSLFFLLLAIKHYLTRFSIMYSEKGIVVGAGYTDVAVFLPIINILIVFAVLIAVFIFFWMIFSKKTFKTRSFLMYTIIAYFIIAFVGQSFIPGVVQSLKVSPNEINL
ncbi:COG1615 family transporter, partial [Candidatus Woesearchaeota archaeon]|nr:COG1615 family transporter [Candidatus Woesearchaeota archaeon]